MSWKFPISIDSVASLTSSLIAKINANRSEGQTLFSKALSFDDCPFDLGISTSTAPMRYPIDDSFVASAFTRGKGKADCWLKICVFNCSSFSQAAPVSESKIDFFNFQRTDSPVLDRPPSTIPTPNSLGGVNGLESAKTAFERSRTMLSPHKLVPSLGPSSTSSSRRNIEEMFLAAFQLCSEHVQTQESIDLIKRETALFKLRTTCLKAIDLFFQELSDTEEPPSSRSKRNRPVPDDLEK